MNAEYPTLFQPGRIGKAEIKNRLVMTSVLTGLANKDGTVSEGLIVFYETRAAGGAGLIITEATRVTPGGCHNKWQLGAFDDGQIEGLTQLAQRIHTYGTSIFMQLYHPGSQTTNKLAGGELLTPSGQPSKALPTQKCREMTQGDIDTMVKAFADAATRAKTAGFDGVELNAAHGYLLGEFLSPYTNKRADAYGGNVKGRCRLIQEIIQAIRHTVGPDFPITLCISADEFLEKAGIKEDGVNLPEAIAILAQLIPFGLDAVSVSAGTLETQNCAWEPISYPQGWRTYLPETVKHNVSVPVIGTSVIREPAFAEQLLKRNAMDFVGVARGQIADPEWGIKAEQGRACEIRRCISCLHCMQKLVETGHSECAINPKSHHEAEYGPLKVTGENRPVVVVGGGPAGMEAARILALRGYKPILFEKTNRLGGQLLLADKPPHKGKIDWLISYFEERLKVLNVDVRLNTEATAEMIAVENPAFVFLATGSVPSRPASIVGIDGENVYIAPDVLTGKADIRGKQVIVVGDGLTGIETAETLGLQENVVSVVGRNNQIGERIYVQNRQGVLDSLVVQHARFFPRRELVSISAEGITVKNTATDDLIFMPTDAVVISLGVRPNLKGRDEFLKAFPNAILLGDAIRGGRIADAVHTAYDAVTGLM
ncbi:MAG: FAD-dependent oxidoreductase [Oscillospiraceae bacterium]